MIQGNPQPHNQVPIWPVRLNNMKSYPDLQGLGLQVRHANARSVTWPSSAGHRTWVHPSDPLIFLLGI